MCECMYVIKFVFLCVFMHVCAIKYVHACAYVLLSVCAHACTCGDEKLALSVFHYLYLIF